MIEIYVIRKDDLLLVKPLEERVVIGSDAKCDISLPGKLEPMHASLEAIGKKILLNELGGDVYFNGQRIAGSVALRSNDIFDLGDYRIQIREKASGRKVVTCKTLTATRNTTADGANDQIPIFTVHQPQKKSFCQLRILVGRGSECDLRIPDDAMTRKNVSRRHAEIHVSKGNYYVSDLGSKNGTSLYDYHIGNRPLPRRGTICLGRYELPYEIETAASASEEEGILIPSLNPNIAPRHMIGSSAAMQILREKLDRAVSANQTVLILGENGTGKDLCAKYLHFYHPKRKKGPFVAVNCASIPKQLTESFLFGHVKGAFTGASESAQGVFEQANSGTLFLDEIGELSMDMQAQLLRVIEDGLVRPVGSNKSKAVDVRIVCATNRDIDAERQKKNFRDDLYYRCQNIIRVPSLRERRDDIVSLAKYFLACSAKPLEISDDAFSALQLYPWPGNVRELSSTIEGAILNASFRGSSVITESDLQLQTQLAPTLTKMKVINLLEKHRGNVSEVAAACDVSRKTLYQWMREFEISPTSFRNRSLLSLK